MAKRLLKKIEFKGTLKLLTGLHIGGTNSSMSIGGIDKGVIRNPLTNQPFIPGSSLKGKMRSLLEVSKGTFEPVNMGTVKNGASKSGDAANLFGNATGDPNTQKPSRMIVRDCNLENANWLLSKTDIPYTEGKTEVMIDRITSAANPRQIERVPAGAEFTLNLVLNIWEGENESGLVDSLFQSLKLLKDDYLGGSGSRGYGQVSINIEDVVEKTTENYYAKAEGRGNSVKSQYQARIDSLRL